MNFLKILKNISIRRIRERSVSFGLRLGLVMSLVTMGSTGATVLLIYYGASKIMIDATGGRLLDIGRTGTFLFSQEDREALKHLKTITATKSLPCEGEVRKIKPGETVQSLRPDDADELMRREDFQSIIQKLRQVKFGSRFALEPLAWIPQRTRYVSDPPMIKYAYILVAVSGYEDRSVMKFLADSDYEALDGEQGNPIGALYRVKQDAFVKASTGTPSAERKLISDQWGTWLSAAVPILDTDGSVIAILGMDYDVTSATRKVHDLLKICLIILGITLAISLVCAAFMTRRLSKPLTALTSCVRLLGKTGFALTEVERNQLHRLAQDNRDEIGQLSQAFSEMAVKLQEYIRDLRETTAAKERIESELKIAHDIQMSFIHKIFPPFPNRREIDLHATLEPAKEVGGDFYDFGFIDDDHLYFCVGDVSDKGVAAALFMAVTITLMKRAAREKGSRPADILTQVNLELAEGNENLMFVTAFLGILNLKTGELTYSNAGHNPPILIYQDGHSDWLQLPAGTALGIMPSGHYLTQAKVLHPGDTLVVYTDGITEARNQQGEFFLEDRLKGSVTACALSAAMERVTCLLQSVREFASGVQQSDDITILALTFKG